MKLYLDTNIVSAIERQDQPSEVDAISEVVSRGEAGLLTLVTSKVTRDEIDRCQGPHAPAIQDLYESIKKIPYVQYEAHVGFHTYWYEEMGVGGSDPAYDVNQAWQSLRSLGLDTTDAHHIMLALRDGCEVFLTCDQKTILKHRQKIEPVHSIRLLKPSEFIAEHVKRLLSACGGDSGAA